MLLTKIIIASIALLGITVWSELSWSSKREFRDPTVPLEGLKVRDSVSKSMTLHAVIKKANESYAIINGSRYTLGDMIQGARLTEINKFSVVIQGPNSKTRLSLWPKVR